MATLADEFLADLGDESKQEEKKEEENALKQEEEGEGAPMEDEDELSMQYLHFTDTKQLGQFLHSKKLKDLLEEVDEALARTYQIRAGKLPGIEDSQYDLVIEANTTSLEIYREIVKITGFIREHYKKKFPELEGLILNPVDYAKTIIRIGNEMDLSGVDFSAILPQATIMVVTVTATTSSGVPLSEDELRKVQEACHLVLSLEEARKRILEFVESKMEMIAPNLSAIVGSTIAAKMMGAAGGLDKLAKLQSQSVMSLGKVKKSLQGLSSATVKLHAGYIHECELIMQCPMSLRKKAAKVIGAKCTLAARCDAFRDDPSGAYGRDMKDFVLTKIEKWQEPAQARLPKPLAAPDDKPKKRRGGKRIRKIKQKYEMTELRKQANRVMFGTDAQENIGLTSKTLGTLGLGGGGRVRLSAVDKGILKKKPLASTPSVAGGFATSLAFTPAQGLALANPDLQKVKAANEKYFGLSTFTKTDKKT